MMGKPTKTADPRSWGLMDSRKTAEEPARDLTRPSTCDYSCVAWSV